MGWCDDHILSGRNLPISSALLAAAPPLARSGFVQSPAAIIGIRTAASALGTSECEIRCRKGLQDIKLQKPLLRPCSAFSRAA